MACMPLSVICSGLFNSRFFLLQVQQLRLRHMSTVVDPSTQKFSDGAEYVRAVQIIRLAESNGPPPYDLPMSMIFDRATV